jgi:serine/threonine-protein kinase
VNRSDPRGAPLIGVVLEGAYRITRLLGEGGMGTVYEGQQLRLNKRVAVKVMARELAANREALSRFHREAEVTSSIGHPHIVHVFDFGSTPTGEPFMVMEFLDGEDLEGRLRRVGRLPPANVLHVVKQASSALTATHQQGIVHRDLKPANIYLLNVAGEVDFVKVVDFGISKVRAAATKLTRSSVVMGSPQYMSPEQALGRVDEIDLRTDEWALACITWEMLTGSCPFNGEDVASLLYQVVHEDPPPLESKIHGLRPEAEEVLRCALSKSRADRFSTVSAFARALETAIYGSVPNYEPTPPPQVVVFSQDTVVYGSTNTEGVIRASHGGAAGNPPPTQEQKPSLTTFTHTAGEVAHRSRLPVPFTKRMIAIAGGSLLLLLFGAFLIFRSGVPAKDRATSQPVRVPAATHPPRVTITPTPSLPPPEILVDQPAHKTGETPTKTKRPKPSVDPGAKPADPFEDSKISLTPRPHSKPSVDPSTAPISPFEDSRVPPPPRPHPKPQPRIITDI